MPVRRTLFAKILRRILLRLSLVQVGLLCVVILAVLVVISSFRDTLEIGPFSVPKPLADMGMTSRTLTRAVGNEMEKIEKTSGSKMQSDLFDISEEEAALPEIQVPEVNTGTKAITESIRHIFGLRRRSVTADILMHPYSGPGSSIGNQESEISIYVTKGRPHRPQDSREEEFDPDDVESLAHHMAELTLEMVNPYLLALYLRDKHQPTRALAIVKAAAADKTEDDTYRAASYNLCGIIADSLGESDEAIDFYQRSIAISSNDPEPHSNLGIALKKAGNYSGAINQYQRALSLDHSSYTTQYNLGLLLSEQHLYKEANEHFKLAISINPQYVRAYLAQGINFSALGLSKEAASAYQKAIDQKLDIPEPYFALGMLYLEQGDPEKAIPLFKKAIECEEDFVPAHSALEFSFSNLGEVSEAKIEENKARIYAPSGEQKTVSIFSGWSRQERERTLTGLTREQTLKR